MDLGWSDYGARMYDPSIGRWNVVDKLSDEPEQIQLSPYNAFWDNPTNLNDLDGNCPLCVTALAGAIGGAAFEYGTQVAGNLIEGKSLKRVVNRHRWGCNWQISFNGCTATGAGGGLLYKGASKVVGKLLDKADDGGKFVYRALSKTDDVVEGLSARAPGQTTKPISHVAGKKQTEWISTTKSKKIATEKYNSEGNGVVKINLKKVKTEVKDVSGGIPKGGRFFCLC